MSPTLSLLVLLVAPGFAAQEGAAAPGTGVPDDVLTLEQAAHTLQEMLAWNQAGLALAEAPPLYHLRYRMMVLQSVQAEAAFGSLVSANRSPAHLLGVEVRVGSPRFDNSGLSGWDTGFDAGNLPSHITGRSLRQAAWRLTDTAYKAAVEQYARKQASFVPPADYPGDYTLGLVTGTDVRTPARFEPDRIQDLAVALSAACPTDLGLERAWVETAQEAGDWLVVDTEGSRVLSSSGEVDVAAAVHVRASDGLLLTDVRRWIRRDPTHLPPLEVMQAEVEAMCRELSALRSAPTLADEYVGPVVFEDEAAVELFRTLLVPQLEGTPAPVSSDRDLFSGGGRDDSVRLNRKVLPPGWTVTDDPLREPDHPASFAVDAEGTPARAVTLVTDGIVRTLLMSRVPREGLSASSGHARGLPGGRPAARVSWTQVQPARRVSERRMRREALAAAREYGLDHVMIVRRFQEEPVRSAFENTGSILFGGPSGQDGVPMPVAVYRLYADGREEPVRGAALAGLERWALRDVQAAGPQVEGDYLASFQPGGRPGSVNGGMPTHLSVPEVLVGELEIVPVPADPRDNPVLPPPTP